MSKSKKESRQSGHSEQRDGKKSYRDPSPSGQDEVLIAAAREAAQHAYCPYSHFRVGAAVLTDKNKIIKGCNIENASYGLTICAERTAIFTAISEGHKIKMLALSCIDAKDLTSPSSRMPCGACRQVMAEFLKDDALVIVDHVGTFRLQEILPHGFRIY